MRRSRAEIDYNPFFLWSLFFGPACPLMILGVTPTRSKMVVAGLCGWGEGRLVLVPCILSRREDRGGGLGRKLDCFTSWGDATSRDLPNKRRLTESWSSEGDCGEGRGRVSEGRLTDEGSVGCIRRVCIAELIEASRLIIGGLVGSLDTAFQVGVSWGPCGK